LVVGFISCSSAASADPAATLRDALRETELPFSETSDGSSIVILPAEGPLDIHAWPITIAPVARGEWILVYATVLDGEPGVVPSTEAMTRALAYNARTAGSKLALDLESGDLDVQYEIPIEALTAKVLRRMCFDVAVTCNDLYEEFTPRPKRVP
jgi:hypothetical protein